MAEKIPKTLDVLTKNRPQSIWDIYYILYIAAKSDLIIGILELMAILVSAGSSVVEYIEWYI